MESVQLEAHIRHSIKEAHDQRSEAEKGIVETEGKGERGGVHKSRGNITMNSFLVVSLFFRSLPCSFRFPRIAIL